MKQFHSDILPVTVKEAEKRGWSRPDVILFTGDAYIDHPSFGTAIISRIIEKAGATVVVVPQPNWRDDLRDFKKFGIPRLFFAVTSGSMDSMVNHYTANKRLRSDDAYSIDGKAGFRPDYALSVYSKILKQLFPDTPVVAGGIEASLRRLAHYDYWSDSLKPSVLLESQADLLVYGMAEKAMMHLVKHLLAGGTIDEAKHFPQTVYLSKHKPEQTEKPQLVLNSYEKCLNSKDLHAENWVCIEKESNSFSAKTIVQKTGNKWVVVNPPYPPLSVKEMDEIYELPFTRLPHPKYAGKTIPAFEMIKNSISIHRGCFGGCSFCSIAMHQGRIIQSRSKENIISEVEKLAQMPYFRGTISDLGGPSANMYKMESINKEVCRACKKVSCIFPAICNNLSTQHKYLLDLYKEVENVPGINNLYIGSGVRYDLFLNTKPDIDRKNYHSAYKRALILRHTGGRLKVAPEHSSGTVLTLMRKPSFQLFKIFHADFQHITIRGGKNFQLIPYIMSSHPGCSLKEMQETAKQTAEMGYRLEQVQDFTPTPMTCSTVMFYTGKNPFTKERVFVAKSIMEKKQQQECLLTYKSVKRPDFTNTNRNQKGKKR